MRAKVRMCPYIFWLTLFLKRFACFLPVTAMLKTFEGMQSRTAQPRLQEPRPLGEEFARDASSCNQGLLIRQIVLVSTRFQGPESR
jgi:hypothetical protein